MDFRYVLQSLHVGLFILILWILGCFATEMEEISFDYQHCNSKKYLDVTRTTFQVTSNLKGSSSYSATRCEISFKSEGQYICIKILNMDTDDCNVNLKVFTDKLSKDPKIVLSCSKVPRNSVCSDTSIMKIQLNRKDLETQNYDFRLVVKKSDDLLDGSIKSFLYSIVMVVGIIVVVVFVILVVSFICCCWARRGQRGVVLNTPNTMVAAPPHNAQVAYPNQHLLAMPSAPPMPMDMQNMIPQGDPPPYQDEPWAHP